MTARTWLRLGELLVPVILAITIFVSWQADRRDRAQLASQLAVAQQTMAQATASQHDRDTLLNQTLSQLAAQKQTAVTPAQIIKGLPSAISLPAPITFQSSAAAPSSATNRQDHTGPEPSQASDAVLPAADLRPLYDFALDCKACQAKLAASQGDLTDEKTKTAALTKERDAAVTAAKGGSALRRIARAAKWFALGAAAGAIAAKAVR